MSNIKNNTDDRPRPDGFPATLRSTPALKPTELTEMAARAVEELLREGESRNTLASYRAALRYWAAWNGLRYGLQIALPLPAAVLQFIVDHARHWK